MPPGGTSVCRAIVGWLPLAIALTLQGLATLAGCTPAEVFDASPEQRSPWGTTSRVAIHDAGNVLAGTPVRHTFQFRNCTDQPIHLARQDDIRMSCGCTAAEVRVHALAPGDETPVEVQLNTLSKRGDVSETVTTAWTSADQSIKEYRFELRARIHAALNLSPSEVVFTADDLAKGSGKHIQCTSDLDLDWSQSQLIPLADGLVIERRKISAHGLEFFLSFRPSEASAENRQGRVQVVVPRAGSQRDMTRTVSEALPVYWPSPGLTRIAPAIVTFRSTANNNGWHGWFIVTGDEMKTQPGIRSIEAETCAARIEFRQQRLTPTAVRVDATLTMIRPVERLRPRWIDIVLTSGERKRLRILCSDRHTAKET